MVAFVGIAATAFLLTLQPVFAASNIIARQASNGNGTSFNGTSIPTSCQSLDGCVAVLNITDLTPQTFCNATFINGAESCFECAVNASAGALTQSDVATIISGLLSGCAEASISVTGVSSLPTSTGTGTGTASAASTSATSDASNLSMSAFGIIFTSVLGVIALL